MHKLLDWLPAIFRSRSPRVVPVFPATADMFGKDPELFEEIGPMSIPEGIVRWREKYPEDFADAD